MLLRLHSDGWRAPISLVVVLVVGLLASGLAPAVADFEVETRLTAPDAEPLDFFGAAVAIVGERVLVGAPGGWSDSPGYVFEFIKSAEGSWVEGQVLTASDSTPHGGFGSLVAVDAGIAVIGARPNIYVFELDDAGIWQERQKLFPAGPVLPGQDEFLWDSFAVTGQTILVVADEELGGPGGSGGNSGALFVFERDSTGTWVERQKLLTSDDASSFTFRQVAADGDVAVVGSPFDWDVGVQAGAAYIFSRDAVGTWSQQTKVHASDASDNAEFGWGVAVTEETIFIGAPWQSSTGSVYVFTQKSGEWMEQQILQDGAPPTDFGWSVAADSHRVAVGASGDDGSLGSVYIYDRRPEGWVLSKKVTASTRSDIDEFGVSVDLGQDSLVTGARGDDVNGNLAGAAYIYDTEQHAICGGLDSTLVGRHPEYVRPGRM